MPMRIKETRVRVNCSDTMDSKDDPGHVHTCVGEEDHGDDHFCLKCHRWWGKKGIS